MSLQELGAIGELIGGLAVLLTLIYLAIQTKQTRVAAEETANFASSQATYTTVDTYLNWRTLIVYNPDVSKVIAKARADVPLEDHEQILFSNVFEHLFFAAAASHRGSTENASLHLAFGDENYVLLMLQANPKAVEDWRAMEDLVAAVSPELVSFVNEGLT